MILKPTHEFICDTCGEIIASPQEGVVTSIRNDEGKYHSFQIAHHAIFSPNAKRGRDCYGDTRVNGFGDLPLAYYAAGQPDSMANLLSVLDIGPILDPGAESGLQVVSVREWLELALRVSVPYYEQARFLFGIAASDGEIEGLHQRSIHSEEVLKRIVEKYHERDEF